MNQNQYNKVMLIILDGVGQGINYEGNALYLAKKPFFDWAYQQYPHSILETSGLSVGLPEGQMGNSEVGHATMGCGRIIYQDLVRINRSIHNGDFQKNSKLLEVFDHVKNHQTTLHLMGLLSDGGVHSHETHLYTLIDTAVENGVNRVSLHIILDGRDTSPTSGIHFVEKLNNYISKLPINIHITTISGRYYTMDRDNRWDRIEKAYDNMTISKETRSGNILQEIHSAYDKNETDEFFVPRQFHSDGIIKDNDSFIFFNFRSDRAKQITRSLNYFEIGFQRKKTVKLANYLCFTEYDSNFHLPALFPKLELSSLLGEEISKRNLAQLRLAETEKYAHVTYFFNGGNESVFAKEERILIPSAKHISTYDQYPQMRAIEITEEGIRQIKEKNYHFILINYANGDMVGHTGNLKAGVEAVQCLDSCLDRIVKTALSYNYHVFITADHGNVEEMIDQKTHEILTQHSLNPVPFLYISPQHYMSAIHKGILADIAPTILHTMKIEIPIIMEGKILTSS